MNTEPHHKKEFWQGRRGEILKFLRTCATNHYCYGADKLPDKILNKLKAEVKSSRPRSLEDTIAQYQSEVAKLNPEHMK